MVEDTVDDVRRDVEPGHAGRRRATQVVQDPLPYRCLSGFLACIGALFAQQRDHMCQFASNRDPVFASNRDPSEVLGFGLSL